MKTLTLIVKKKECKETCPIPLKLIPNIEKEVTKINYNEKTKIAKIKYDEKLLSKDQIINKLLRIGYGVKQ